MAHTSSAPQLPAEPPLPIERFGLIALLVGMVIFGAALAIRASFSDRKLTPHQRALVAEGFRGRPSRTKTDLDVYLRAAWAFRTGHDAYKITDDNGWHYLYPPLFAILLMPLADPPASITYPGWAVPFQLSMFIWFLISSALAVLGVHMLANALEGDRPPAPWSRPWVRLRLLTLLFCIPAIGRALARGQTGPLLIFLLAGFTADLIRRRHFRAGLWLAGAICLKIIPAFLLLYPLWRRNARCLVGCLVGLVIGLLVIPVAVIGPQRTWHAYRQIYTQVLEAGATSATHESRSGELTKINATDSNSPLTVMHNLMHLDVPRPLRPGKPEPWLPWVHWSIIAALTAGTLMAAGWGRQGDDPIAITLFVGALILVHIMASPVSHPHYYAMAAIPVLGLIALTWRQRGDLNLGRWTEIVLWSFLVAHALTAAGIVILRDIGIVLMAGLLMWYAVARGLVQLNNPGRPEISQPLT